MARFDVYKGPGGSGFVVDVQSNVLSHIRTRVVVPLLPADGAPPPARDLNPIFDILDVPHVLLPQAMGSMPASLLRKAVSSLAMEHDRIVRAIDIVLSEY